MLSKCRICSTKARQTCENCRSARYCSDLHRFQDFESHSPVCFPVRRKFERAGGQLIATREMKMGEVLYMEKPLLRLPTSLKREARLCLCCANIVDGSYKCSKCNLPMCNETCAKQDEHIPECTLLKKPSADLSTYISSPSYYMSVGIIRSIYKEGSHAEKWKKMQKLLRPLVEQNAFQTELTNMTRDLKQYYNISNYTSSDIKAIFLAISYHGIRLHTPRKVGIYEILNRIPHCCIANAYVNFNKDEHITIQAAQKIEIGEPINVNYCSFYYGFHQRKKFLSNKLDFTCHCIRCEDITDFGTHHNSLACVSCNIGLIIPPKGTDVEWKCNSCDRIETSEQVIGTLRELQDDKTNITDITGCECFLKFTKGLLSEDHHIRIDVKLQLLFLHCSEEWNDKRELCCDEMENRGIEICRNLLTFSLAVTRNGYDPEIGVLKKILFKMLFFRATRISETVKRPSEELEAIWEEIMDILQYVSKVFRDDSSLTNETNSLDTMKKMCEKALQTMGEIPKLSEQFKMITGLF